MSDDKAETTERGELTQTDAKQIRAQIQATIDYLESHAGGSRERSLAVTKLQEGKMWLGMELGNLGGEDLNAKRDKAELSSGGEENRDGAKVEPEAGSNEESKVDPSKKAEVEAREAQPTPEQEAQPEQEKASE